MNDFEIEFAAQLIQGSYPLALEPLRIEKAGPAIGAAGDIVKMIEAVKCFCRGIRSCYYL
jgi:hypothetical protein